MHVRLFYRTQTKLVAGFAATAVLVGALSLAVGVGFINDAVFNEAMNRIGQDLNAADEIYGDYARHSSAVLGMAALDSTLVRLLSDASPEEAAELVSRIRDIAAEAKLDFAGFIRIRDVPVRITLDRDRAVRVDDLTALPDFIRRSIAEEASVSGTTILDRRFLEEEGAPLAVRALTVPVPTPKATPPAHDEITSGMAIAAAVPVRVAGSMEGVLYGGTLLNRNEMIVDRIQQALFRQEVYRGANIGTVTIFQEGIRIATNVETPAGNRAVGTVVSSEVEQHVLDRGLRWSGRAFVVNDWYISAYDPIVSAAGERVGMLYVGVLEAKYTDIRRRTVAAFAAIIVSGMLGAAVVGTVLARRILLPVNKLIAASSEVASGNLSPHIGRLSKDEIGTLQRTFKRMLDALREQAEHRELQTRLQLQQSEKQANIGRLAAGIAHEINNPITSVLTFAHLLLEREDLPDDAREDLRIIAESTERVRKIVRGLLDFSRKGELNPTPTDLNDLVAHAVKLLAHQARSARVTLSFEPGEGIPRTKLDYGLIQSVLVNLIMNAIDACSESDEIKVATRLAEARPESGLQAVEIAVSDTGHGIAPEHRDKLFSPFFTTKEAGEGTGLGLAVARGIVEQHDGTIEFESTEGEGTAFRVRLPVDGSD